MTAGGDGQRRLSRADVARGFFQQAMCRRHQRPKGGPAPGGYLRASNHDATKRQKKGCNYSHLTLSFVDNT
jgi:hypothetical protein